MYILCDQEISEMIEAVDLDGDGQINFEEYKELNAMMNYRLLYYLLSHTHQLAEWGCLVKTGKLAWKILALKDFSERLLLKICFTGK